MFNYSILLAFISLFILGSVDNLKGPIYPEVLDTLNISPYKGSWIFTATSLISLLISLLSIYWFKFLSTINALKIALFLHALTLLFMGLGLEYKSFEYFMISSVLLGIALGIQGICINTVVAENAHGKNSKKIFSALHSMYGLASLSVPVIVSIFLKKNILLKDMLYLMALMTFIVALFLSYKVEDIKIHDKEGSKEKYNLKLLFNLSLTACLYVSSEILISSRYVYFLKSYHQFDIELASLYLSLFFLCLLIGRLFFSFYQFEINIIKLLKLSIIFSFIFNILGLYFYPVFLIFIGLSSSFFFPYFMDYIKSHYSNSNILIARIMINVSFSLALMHFVFGYISDSLGIYSAMHINLGFYPIILYFLHYKLDSFKRIS
jgi:FHS family glucose/mannose:H+ symporter-like MFS transporter